MNSSSEVVCSTSFADTATRHLFSSVVSAAGVRLSAINVGVQPTTFELVTACVGHDDSVSCIIAVV